MDELAVSHLVPVSVRARLVQDYLLSRPPSAGISRVVRALVEEEEEEEDRLLLPPLQLHLLLLLLLPP